MSKEDKEALIEHLEAALAILRKDDTDANLESGGSGNGPPGGP